MLIQIFFPGDILELLMLPSESIKIYSDIVVFRSVCLVLACSTFELMKMLEVLQCPLIYSFSCSKDCKIYQVCNDRVHSLVDSCSTSSTNYITQFFPHLDSCKPYKKDYRSAILQSRSLSDKNLGMTFLFLTSS